MGLQEQRGPYPSEFSWQQQKKNPLQSTQIFGLLKFPKPLSSVCVMICSLHWEFDNFAVTAAIPLAQLTALLSFKGFR